MHARRDDPLAGRKSRSDDRFAAGLQPLDPYLAAHDRTVLPADPDARPVAVVEERDGRHGHLRSPRRPAYDGHHRIHTRRRERPQIGRNAQSQRIELVGVGLRADAPQPQRNPLAGPEVEGRLEAVEFAAADILRAGDIDSLTPVFSCESEATGRDREDQPDYKVKMSAAFCFSNKVQMLEYYHNSSWLEHGGSPEHAVRTAFVYQINKYLKDKNLYKKGESAISFQDVQDCLVYVSSSFSTRTSYENQTKKAITNKFVSQAMTDFLKHYLEVYFLEKPDEAQKICQQVLVNKQSREHAEKTRQSIKKTLTTQIDLANRVQKFVDCRTKDASRRELYIVEGDSAMGAVKTSRDSEYQAIMPIRGKILNCLKADYARIFKSDVIVDLIKVMGCGVELGGKHNKELATFNLDNLRFNKIVICTDADVDGYQIRTLVLTMLYRLTPTLINEGYVYIAESPLYEITTKDRTYFAYTEPEKATFLEEIGDKKYTIQRSKGLGENDPEMMWLTTMNPESRRLIKVMPTDVERTAQVFDILLGDNLAGRKEHIAQHGAEYLDDLDVS